jgi:hypothetical protein
VDPEPGKTAPNIREHYLAQLENLGLKHIARRPVAVECNNSPLYDIVLASRHTSAARPVEPLSSARDLRLPGRGPRYGPRRKGS